MVPNRPLLSPRGSSRRSLPCSLRRAVAAVSAAAIGLTVQAGVPAAATPTLAVHEGTHAANEASAAHAEFDVLIFSRTTGFRHDSIDEGIAAITELGVENHFSVTATEDPGQFTDANLEQYEAVIWLSTTSDVLNDTQQGAFERYVQAGGGYVGIHAASDTEYTWPWYGDLVGAYFQSHPAGTPTATIDVEDAEHPSSCFLPSKWQRTDEWYNFQNKDNPSVGGGGADYSPRGDVNVIATLDESTYVENDGNSTDDDHPIAWYHEFDGGRSFYTGGGHTAASFSEPLFRLHLLGGIEYSAGQSADACAEAPPTDDDFEQVTLAKGVEKVGEPMSISVLPDGRVLHNARDGRVFLTDLEGNTQNIATVPVYQHDEDGLQSLTVDPNFAENNWVYLYYAPPLNTPAGDAPNDGTPATFEPWRGHNVLSRVKFVDDELDMSTEQELLQVEADRGICCHAGGAIDFDADGNLYLSTGDDSNPFASDGYSPLDERPGRNPAYDAQRSSGNTNDLRGKVLRITPDPTEATYTIPDGNLFDESAPTGDKTRPEIYAMGFRNPFRMTVDQETGYVYLGEYGPDAGSTNPNRGPGGIVEFNQIREAGNFGWPYCAGPNTPATTYNEFDFATRTSGPKFDCTAPVNDSPNNTGLTQLPPAQAAWIHYDGGNVTYNGKTTNEFGGGGEGPMAGPVYNYDPDLESDVKFPEYFDRHFFAGEWTRSWIKDIALDAQGDITSIAPFFDSSVLYAPMDMEFGPDGSLYVLDYGNGGYFQGNENSAVYKFNYINAGERAPTAVATADPRSGQAPLEVAFSSEGSSDPDNGDSITGYAWDFDGDGTVDSTEADPTHTYTENGEYDARLTVTDSTGRTGSATVVVVVGNTEPDVEIVAPPNGSFFEFGDPVHVQVEVNDAEQDEIDCSQVTLDYILGHDSHGHPLSTRQGCDVVLPTVADEGHDSSANVFGVINAHYTDEGANGVRELRGEDEIILQPKRKEAEHFTDQQGVQTEATTDPRGGARNLSVIDDGDWVMYSPVSLFRVDQLRFRVASAGAGGTLEARLDSPTGALVGSVDVAPTGGWQSWESVTMDVDPATQSGTHELYLVFKNPGQTGLFNVNYFEAIGSGASDNSRPHVEATATPERGEAPLPVEFSAEATDADSDELTYAWDFGVPGTDADTASTPQASWTYETPGTYTARVTVTDPEGATHSSSVTVRVTQACGDDPVAPSDEFDGNLLDPCRWNANVRERPDLYEVADGKLTITTTEGEFYTTADPSTTANLMLQSADRADDDYVLETRMSASFTDGYAQGGLLVYGDDDNYVKLDVLADSGQGRINRAELRSEVNGAIASPTPELAVPANVSSYRMRLTKDGNSYTGEIAFDGGAWTSIGTVTHPTAEMDFGLFTAGVQQPGRDASFEYFRVDSAGTENRPPVAADDSVTTRKDTPVDVAVLRGDTDPDGDQLSVTSVTDPAHGSAEISGTSVRYTPDAGFVGEDTFDYVVSDGQGGSDTGTVTVTVTDSPTCELTTPDDMFDGNELDRCRWNAIVAEDESLLDVADGVLRITTAPGEIYQSGTGKSNLILQSADHAGSDWVLESGADMSGLDGGYSQAGLLAYGDDSTYVKMVAISDDGLSAPNRVELRSEVDDVIVGSDPQPGLDLPADADPSDLRLRLTKEGTTYTGEASFDGGETWEAMPRTVENPMSAPDFGVFAAGVLQSGDVVEFDYVTVDGEDPEPVVVPDTRVVLAPSGTVRNRTARLTFEATGDGAEGATFECSVDGGAYRACTSPTVLRGLRDGRHVVRVRAVGPGGTDPTPAVARWVVDATGPRVAGVKPTGATRDRTPTIRGVVTDALSAVRARDVQVRIDGRKRGFSWAQGRFTVRVGRPMARGAHVVKVVARDAVGNRTVRTWRFRITR